MKYYLICLAVSFSVSFVLTFAVRRIALRFGIMDVPHTSIKTHSSPTPYLGGVSMFAGFWISIMVIRYITDFPTGTLRSLRGILFGSSVLFALGLIDDIKHKGLGPGIKFAIQAAAGILLYVYGISLKFIEPEWFAALISLVWIVGVTNSLNIIDIMDGLGSSVALIAALGFFFIGIPLEEKIYVNFASIALAGVCLGFLPYNLSGRYKIFMGDTGSLFLGFMLASVSMGTSYTHVSHLGVFAPIIILAIPIYETLLVIYFRWKRGILPFLGSKDHYALRLEKAGFSRRSILIMTCLAGLFLAFCAFVITVANLYFAFGVILLIAVCAVLLGYELSRIEVDG